MRPSWASLANSKRVAGTHFAKLFNCKHFWLKCRRHLEDVELIVRRHFSVSAFGEPPNCSPQHSCQQPPLAPPGPPKRGGLRRRRPLVVVVVASINQAINQLATGDICVCLPANRTSSQRLREKRTIRLRHSQLQPSRDSLCAPRRKVATLDLPASRRAGDASARGGRMQICTQCGRRAQQAVRFNANNSIRAASRAAWGEAKVFAISRIPSRRRRFVRVRVGGDCFRGKFSRPRHNRNERTAAFKAAVGVGRNWRPDTQSALFAAQKSVFAANMTRTATKRSQTSRNESTFAAGARSANSAACLAICRPICGLITTTTTN